MKSNTPRTDKIRANFSEPSDAYAPIEDFEQLETELADANTRADEWKRMAEELAKVLGFCRDEMRYSVKISQPISENRIEFEQANQTLAKFDQMKGKL